MGNTCTEQLEQAAMGGVCDPVHLRAGDGVLRLAYAARRRIACSIAMLGGITWELGATKGLHPLSQMIWTLVVFLVVGVIAWSIYDYRQRTQPTYASRDDVKMAMIDRVHHGHWPFTLAVFMAVTIILLYMLIDQKHLSELSQLLYVVIVLLAFIVVAWAVFDSRTKGSSTTYVPIAEIDSYAMSVNRPADDDD